jgi:hypothetical protein
MRESGVSKDLPACQKRIRLCYLREMTNKYEIWWSFHITLSCGMTCGILDMVYTVFHIIVIVKSGSFFVCYFRHFHLCTVWFLSILESHVSSFVSSGHLYAWSFWPVYLESSTWLITTVIAFQAQHNYIIFVNSKFLRNNLVETEIQWNKFLPDYSTTIVKYGNIHTWRPIFVLT